MKFPLFILLSFITLSLANAQKGVKVVYHKFDVNPPDSSRFLAHLRDVFLKEYEKPQTHILMTTKDKSVYTFVGFGNPLEKSVIQRSEDPTYKDFQTKRMIWQMSFPPDTVLVELGLREDDWTIRKEYAIIAGYKCQRATKSRIDSEAYEEVWFALDIPYENGPAYFDGLPGLILKAENKFSKVEAQEITFEDNIEINIPQGETITYKEYMKLGKEYMEKSKNKD